MNCWNLSSAAPLLQCTCVRTWPTSLVFWALSSRKRPSVTRSSSLCSRAPLHWRSRRLWSWVSSRTSSFRSSCRSSRAWLSCRKSASVSMHTSILPIMYLFNSAMSCAIFLSRSSMSSLLSPHSRSRSLTRLSEVSSSSLSATVCSPISFSSCTLMALIFSMRTRVCLAWSMRARSRPSSAGSTSLSILLSTLFIIAFRKSDSVSSFLSDSDSISFSLASISAILKSCTWELASTPLIRVKCVCSLTSIMHSPWPAFSKARRRSPWCLIMP
mmetsp:Transcript_90674/g.270620  ORF Transcript_90674/g.270620 Transcript_90674/m.270620 type:complete len:271 (-) Transcript_90674:256-1068(-)